MSTQNQNPLHPTLPTQITPIPFPIPTRISRPGSYNSENGNMFTTNSRESCEEENSWEKEGKCKGVDEGVGGDESMDGDGNNPGFRLGGVVSGIESDSTIGMGTRRELRKDKRLTEDEIGLQPESTLGSLELGKGTTIHQPIPQRHNSFPRMRMSLSTSHLNLNGRIGGSGDQGDYGLYSRYTTNPYPNPNQLPIGSESAAYPLIRSHQSQAESSANNISISSGKIITRRISLSYAEEFGKPTRSGSGDDSVNVRSGYASGKDMDEGIGIGLWNGENVDYGNDLDALRGDGGKDLRVDQVEEQLPRTGSAGLGLRRKPGMSSLVDGQQPNQSQVQQTTTHPLASLPQPPKLPLTPPHHQDYYHSINNVGYQPRQPHSSMDSNYTSSSTSTASSGIGFNVVDGGLVREMNGQHQGRNQTQYWNDHRRSSSGSLESQIRTTENNARGLQGDQVFLQQRRYHEQQQQRRNQEQGQGNDGLKLHHYSSIASFTSTSSGVSSASSSILPTPYTSAKPRSTLVRTDGFYKKNLNVGDGNEGGYPYTFGCNGMMESHLVERRQSTARTDVGATDNVGSGLLAAFGDVSAVGEGEGVGSRSVTPVGAFGRTTPVQRYKVDDGSTARGDNNENSENRKLNEVLSENWEDSYHQSISTPSTPNHYQLLSSPQISYFDGEVPLSPGGVQLPSSVITPGPSPVKKHPSNFHGGQHYSSMQSLPDSVVSPPPGRLLQRSLRPQTQKPSSPSGPGNHLGFLTESIHTAPSEIVDSISHPAHRILVLKTTSPVANEKGGPPSTQQHYVEVDLRKEKMRPYNTHFPHPAVSYAALGAKDITLEGVFGDQAQIGNEARAAASKIGRLGYGILEGGSSSSFNNTSSKALAIPAPNQPSPSLARSSGSVGQMDLHRLRLQVRLIKEIHNTAQTPRNRTVRHPSEGIRAQVEKLSTHIQALQVLQLPGLESGMDESEAITSPSRPAQLPGSEHRPAQGITQGSLPVATISYPTVNDIHPRPGQAARIVLDPRKVNLIPDTASVPLERKGMPISQGMFPNMVTRDGVSPKVGPLKYMNHGQRHQALLRIENQRRKEEEEEVNKVVPKYLEEHRTVAPEALFNAILYGGTKEPRTNRGQAPRTMQPHFPPRGLPIPSQTPSFVQSTTPFNPGPLLPPPSVPSSAPSFKSDVCRTYHLTGHCTYGDNCFFIHLDAQDTLGIQPSSLVTLNHPVQGVYLQMAQDRINYDYFRTFYRAQYRPNIKEPQSQQPVVQEAVQILTNPVQLPVEQEELVQSLGGDEKVEIVGTDPFSEYREVVGKAQSLQNVKLQNKIKDVPRIRSEEVFFAGRNGGNIARTVQANHPHATHETHHSLSSAPSINSFHSNEERDSEERYYPTLSVPPPPTTTIDCNTSDKPRPPGAGPRPHLMQRSHTIASGQPLAERNLNSVTEDQRHQQATMSKQQDLKQQRSDEGICTKERGGRIKAMQRSLSTGHLLRTYDSTPVSPVEEVDEGVKEHDKWGYLVGEENIWTKI